MYFFCKPRFLWRLIFRADVVVVVFCAVPVPQASADPEPADRDRVERGAVSAVLSAALRALEPHALSRPHPLLQLLRSVQAAAGPHRAGEGVLAPARNRRPGLQVSVRRGLLLGFHAAFVSI